LIEQRRWLLKGDFPKHWQYLTKTVQGLVCPVLGLPCEENYLKELEDSPNQKSCSMNSWRLDAGRTATGVLASLRSGRSAWTKVRLNSH